MRRNIVLLAVIAIVVCIVSIPSAKAGIPEIISYQGIITDADGTPLHGTYRIIFRIYDQASGGADLWSETHETVVVNDGKFNVLLGSGSSLSDDLDFDVPYWLGVSINGGDELTPRTQFASTATAFAAKKVIGRVLPAGMVAPFATASPPVGWLECKGQEVSRTAYADLYAAIGTMYGAGNGSTTFNLPDYRGYFLRGWSNDSGRDPDANSRTNRGDGITGNQVGTKQGDENKSHHHNYIRGANTMQPAWGGYNSVLRDITWKESAKSGGSESRPKNINVLYCIKM